MWQTIATKFTLYLCSLIIALGPYIQGHTTAAWTVFNYFEVAGIVAGLTITFLTRSPLARPEWTQAERTAFLEKNGK